MIKLRGFNRSSESNFFEYLVYFTIILIINTILLGGALYYYSSQAMTNETIKANDNTLEQLKSAQEVIMREVDKSFVSIFLDQRYMEFMEYYNSGDYLTLKQLQDNISNLVFSNDNIDSVEIFYQKEGVVLSSNVGIEKIDKFYDKEFLEQLKSMNIKNSYVKTRVLSQYSTRKTISIISFIKPIPILYSDRPLAYVVINFRDSYLQNMVDLIKTKVDSYIVITDIDGNVISYSPKAPYFKQNIINKAAVSGTKGFFFQDINREESLVSYVFSQNYEWWYYYIVPLSSITSGIRLMRIVTALVCLLVMFIGILISLFFSKRIYSPIQKILELLNAMGHSDEGTKGIPKRDKETLVITKRVKQMVDRNKDLEGLLKDYEIYQKNVFLTGLLNGPIGKDEKILDKLEYYHISLDIMGIFVVCIMSMDDYHNFISKYSEEQKNMYFIHIIENISSLLAQYDRFIVETGPNEIAVVMNFPLSIDLSEVENMVNILSEKIHSLISNDSKYTFTLGISAPHTSIEKIFECYNEASTAVNYRIVFGHNSIINYKDIKMREKVRCPYPFSIEKKILDSLKVGDAIGLSTAVEEFTGYISSNFSVEIGFIRYYFLTLISSIFKYVYEMGEKFEPIFHTQVKVYMAIMQEETMSGILNILQQLYTSILDCSNKQRNDKNKEMVSAVLDYIAANLGYDMSVESIAKHFFISETQLRKIFKIETGITIKAYIDNARIREAKILLENPDLKISEIAERIGYMSSQTFTRAFKSAVGLTPGEYRARAAMQSKATKEQ